MGRRTNYAIRRDGRVRLFHSQWGGLSVPQDIFWGPAFAARFFEQNEPPTEWLNTIWGEGGAALDVDRSHSRVPTIRPRRDALE